MKIITEIQAMKSAKIHRIIFAILFSSVLGCGEKKNESQEAQTPPSKNSFDADMAKTTSFKFDTEVASTEAIDGQFLPRNTEVIKVSLRLGSSEVPTTNFEIIFVPSDGKFLYRVKGVATLPASLGSPDKGILTVRYKPEGGASFNTIISTEISKIQ
jgi:hypothetical protein